MFIESPESKISYNINIFINVCIIYIYMRVYIVYDRWFYSHTQIYIYIPAIIWYLHIFTLFPHSHAHCAAVFERSAGLRVPAGMVETERRRFSGEAAGEARRRSATAEGCRRRSPRREPISSRVSKTKTLLSQLERQKVPLMKYDPMGWYCRRQTDADGIYGYIWHIWIYIYMGCLFLFWSVMLAKKWGAFWGKHLWRY